VARNRKQEINLYARGNGRPLKGERSLASTTSREQPATLPRRDGKQSAAYFLHARAHPSWRIRGLARYLARRRRRPLNALWNSDFARRRWPLARASNRSIPESNEPQLEASRKGSFPVRASVNGSLKERIKQERDTSSRKGFQVGAGRLKD